MKSIVIKTKQCGVWQNTGVIAIFFLIPPVISSFCHIAFGFEDSMPAAIVFRWPLLSFAFDLAVPVLLSLYSISEAYRLIVKREKILELKSIAVKLSILIILC